MQKRFLATCKWPLLRFRKTFFNIEITFLNIEIISTFCNFLTSRAYFTMLLLLFTSVRRIFERGPGNLKIMKTKRKISPPIISPFFCPKLGEDQKKGLHPDSVRCPLVYSNFLPKLQRGAMPQFCILFYANYTILATQRGHGTMPPLNTPLLLLCLPNWILLDFIALSCYKTVYSAIILYICSIPIF